MAWRRDSHFGLRRESAFACAFTEDDAIGDCYRHRVIGPERDDGIANEVEGGR
jgi:hypothetical protein